jgi:hypothetical protein
LCAGGLGLDDHGGSDRTRLQEEGINDELDGIRKTKHRFIWVTHLKTRDISVNSSLGMALAYRKWGAKGNIFFICF